MCKPGLGPKSAGDFISDFWPQFRGPWRVHHSGPNGIRQLDGWECSGSALGQVRLSAGQVTLQEQLRPWPVRVGGEVPRALYSRKTTSSLRSPSRQ